MSDLMHKYKQEEEIKHEREVKLSDYINIGVCTLIMLFFFVSMFFTTNGGFSEQEKRDLATFPKLSETSIEEFFDGEYFSKIGDFYKDNFVHRQEFLALSDTIDKFKGIDTGIKMTVAANNKPTEDINNTEEQKTKEHDSQADEELNNAKVERVGSLLSIDNMVCEAYGFNEPTVNEYAEVIKKFGDTLTNSHVYNVLVPTHVEFALPAKYKKLSAEQKPVIDLVFSKIGDNVTPVDTYSILKEHRNEYIYFRSDHHWTQLGAYYGYTEFCKVAGLEPVDINDYETEKIEDFLGTYYSASKEEKLRENPDYVEYRPVGGDLVATIYQNSALTKSFEYSPYSDYSKGANAYGVFLHGDNPLTVIKNPEVTTGKKAVVIKESYGNAFAPFLTQNYSELYVIDMRYFNDNLKGFVDKHQIDDVVFINNMVAVGSQARVDELKKLLG
ncbi:MAG: DHHW family protein [Intestinibacter sp.]|uniref:DHHW family protein n=1 Tax=Intestinibacter sp. TaxID=1965304 RepID=UPI003F15A07E